MNKNGYKKLRASLRKANRKNDVGPYKVRHRCASTEKKVFETYLDAQEYVTERRRAPRRPYNACLQACRVMPTKAARALREAESLKVAA